LRLVLRVENIPAKRFSVPIASLVCKVPKTVILFEPLYPSTETSIAFPNQNQHQIFLKNRPQCLKKFAGARPLPVGSPDNC
jgi:hypothetical protein